MTERALGGYAATEHERELIGLLRRWQHRADLPQTARQGVRWALDEWQRGIDLRSDLLTGRHDADARLATIRLGLLELLAVLWPLEAPDQRRPGDAWASSRMQLLLARGDETARGWCVAVRDALEAVAATPLAEPPSADPERLRRSARVVAVAPTLWRMSWPSAGETVALGCAAPEAPGAPATELHCTVARADAAAVHRTMSVPAWRALHACCAGLFAVDRLELASNRAATARQALADAVHTLSGAGKRWNETSVAQAVANVLDACAAQVGRRNLAAVIRETVPRNASMALVLHGLDLLAGAGTGYGSRGRARMFAPPLTPSRMDDDEQ